MPTLDLGLVVGMQAGTTAPSNTIILWYDENVNLVRYYNTNLSEWVLLATQSSQQTTSATVTYTISGATNILKVFYDGLLKTPNDWSFDSGTHILTLKFQVATGINLVVDYN